MADLVLSAATTVILVQNDISVTSSEVDLIPAMASGHAAEVFNASITNVHASTIENVIVRRYIGATGTEIFKGPLKPGGTLIVASETAPRFLNEGDKITVQGTSASGVFKASGDWKEYS